MKKRGFRILPKAMKAKYNLGDIVRASGIYECSICSNYQAFKKQEHFSQCQDCINSNAKEDNQWYVTNELVYLMSKNMNIEFDKISDISIKVADTITEAAGTVSFFFIHIVWFTTWILLNRGFFGAERVFDPFPFGLLTMIVSLEAIFLSTFILMSQNVASKKAELRAEHEYQVNLETEKNVAEILAMVKEIREGNDIRTEHIEDIKETVEEISEQIDSDEGSTAVTAQDIEDKIDKHIEEKIEEKIEEHIEQHEKESFEEHEKLMDEIGIDIIPESAPPIILDEVQAAEEEELKDKVMDIKETLKKKSARRKKKSQNSNNT